MSRNKTAVSFYDLIDSWVGQGIEDFTEGMYLGNPITDYFQAQRNQHDYLLQQAGCFRGTRLLDLGCGNGTLLQRAKSLGINGRGITISPIQVERCWRKGLDVHLLDYTDIPQTWNNYFDGIIANGSGEHFVTPEDALNGSQDKIYRELFIEMYNLLKNKGKFVTTMIHFNRKPSPKSIFENALTHPWNSDDMHYSFVLGNLGCYYPSQGQLEKCAKDYFKLEREVDGTEDYRITSEHWLDHLWPSCLASTNFWKNLAVKGVKSPRHTVSSLFQYVFTQSWNWQFRPDKYGETPTKLLRQTWIKV